MAVLDNPETIHRVLVFGEIDEIKAMEHEVGIEKIRQAYLHYPKKISRTALMFVNRYILNNQELIDERRYLKDTSRNLG